MEEDEIPAQPCKFSRVSNGDEDGKPKRSNLAAGSAAIVAGGDSNHLRGWHHSSRIIRVSRASGGKDRHSKVWTSKGLRDRRVRLSVTTAIQFYDLQDRLGYDQPSKAVEWLIKNAADAINELPSLDGSNFPDTPKQLNDEKGFDSVNLELEDRDPDQDPNFNNQTQHFSKSACSSNSDTSKGSGLSLSRSDVRVNRVKARERARERTAKEKEKDVGQQNLNPNPNPISQNSSFTELLTSGFGTVNNNNNNSEKASASERHWPFTQMDYFNSGLLGPSSSRTPHNSTGFSGQIQSGNSIQQAMTMSINPPFNFENHHHHHHQHQHHEQIQHFPFLPDHLIPASQNPGQSVDYNLNFTISSGLAGFNRGTLQSNSSSPNSLMPHLHRFSSSNSPMDTSSNLPFFIGATPPPQPHPMENHHLFPPGLQLYGDGSSRHSDHKGKGKN